MPRNDGSERCRACSGFSLLEVLIALSITLVVMALVAQTMSHVTVVYEAQTELATTSSSTTLALDDIAYEVSLAGQGIGEGIPTVLPRVPGGAVEPSAITLRSNPAVVAGVVLGAVDQGKDVAIHGAVHFEEGASVLLVDDRGTSEVAEVERASETTLALRSLETQGGTFVHRFTRETGARAVGLREVRYFVREAGGDGVLELVKETVGIGTRVLARDVTALAFEYLDARGEPIALGKVADSGEVATVRISVSYLPGEDAQVPYTFVTAAGIAPASGTIDFESRDAHFRLSRIFHPIDHPAGVASRAGSDWGVILAAGADPQRDAAYAYTFPLEQQFLGAMVDDIAFFHDVRAPVTLAFGPERGPLAGSLFVSAWGLRVGHLTRMAPDAGGGLSEESEVTVFEGTDAIAQAGGMTFAVDDALYITSREKGAIYRYRFDDAGRPGKPEHLFQVPGTPGAIVEGTDGHLYFLLDREGHGVLWKMAFDETLSPLQPTPVGELPGLGLSLTRDPIEGSLYALVRPRIEDFVVVELSRGWIQASESGDVDGLAAPPVVFSLEDWQRRLEEGSVTPQEIPFTAAELPEKMSALRTDELDFLSFDGLGSLYLGASEANLVLKFELPRPSGRYSVSVAAGVVDRGPTLAPELRFHAWQGTP